jgi:hypothetical protein
VLPVHKYPLHIKRLPCQKITRSCFVTSGVDYMWDYNFSVAFTKILSQILYFNTVESTCSDAVGGPGKNSCIQKITTRNFNTYLYSCYIKVGSTERDCYVWGSQQASSLQAESTVYKFCMAYICPENYVSVHEYPEYLEYPNIPWPMDKRPIDKVDTCIWISTVGFWCQISFLSD